MTPLCAGDACDVVSVTWDPRSERYRVHNSADRPVLVVFRSWPRDTRLVIDAGGTTSALLTEFEQPYLARFLDG